MNKLLLSGFVLIAAVNLASGYRHCHSKPKCEDGSNPACSCKVDGEEVGCGKRSGCRKEDSVYECFDGGPINYGDFQDKYKCPTGQEKNCKCSGDDTLDCIRCPPWDWEVSCSDGTKAAKRDWKDYHKEKPFCVDGSTPACSCKVDGKEVGCGWKKGCKRENAVFSCGAMGSVMYGMVEKKYECPIDEELKCECTTDVTKKCEYCPTKDWEVTCSKGSEPEENLKEDLEYRKSKGKAYCEEDGSKPICTCGEGGLDCHEARCEKERHFYSCPDSGALNYGSPGKKYECPEGEELSCICSDNNPNTCSYCAPLDWILTCSNGSEATKVDWKRKYKHHDKVRPDCQDGSTPACSCKVDGKEVGCGHHSGCESENAVFSCEDKAPIEYGDFQKKYECKDDAEATCKCANDDSLACNNCHPKNWEITCPNGKKAMKKEKSDYFRHHGKSKPRCDDGRSPACSCQVDGKELGCGYHSDCEKEDRVYNCGADVEVNYGDFAEKYQCPAEEKLTCECETDEDLDCSRCPNFVWDVTCSGGSEPEEQRDDDKKRSWRFHH